MDPRTTSRSATEPVDSASNPLRVVVADDDTLLREGLMILPHPSGFEVVGQAGDATNLVPLIQDKRPDWVVLDIRMPPTNTTEGLEQFVEAC